MERNTDSEKRTSGYIVINGLKWDTENLAVGGTVINGNHYYTFDEAQEAAKSVGKRCPTTEDFKKLFDLGYTWDDEKKGYWVAGNHDTDHEGSLFFPAAGYRFNSNGSLFSASSNGCYWSSSPGLVTSNIGGIMFFNSNGGGVVPRHSPYWANGFSVRCVLDIK